MVSVRVLGVDACKDGWLGVALTDRFDQAYAAAEIADLVRLAERDGPVEVIGIDIPIGLPETGQRSADLEARCLLRSRRSTLFITPIRAALLVADDHPRASQLSRDAGAGGISRQAYGLRTKILDVDRWTERAGRRVIEVHPELAFLEMAGEPVLSTKKSWAGMAERLALLGQQGIELPAELGVAGRAAVDDVVDAAAVAWTARRYARGQAVPVPEEPVMLPDGTRCAIWR